MKRPVVTLLTAAVFVVISVTGVLAFIRPFSLQIVGLHALMGFLFVGVVGFHIVNNLKPLKGHLRRKQIAGGAVVLVAVLAAVIWMQPAPVKALLGLSANVGPALDRFEMNDDGMVFNYSPDPAYKMRLSVKTAGGYDLADPPAVAIWLENQGGFHIKTLRRPEGEREIYTPYWQFKRAGWLAAKEEAEKKGASLEEADADGVTEATPNGSFDPADYILPSGDETTPYKLLIEVNQPGDAHGDYTDQPSLVYAVEVDNRLPVTYQVLDIVGYPKLEKDEDGEDAWPLYYVDGSFGSALDLIDSALLTIQR